MQMQQAAVAKAVHEVQAKTFLDDLNAVITAGTFTDTENPATDDEPVIGEMSDYERALYTVAANNRRNQRELFVKNFDAFQNFTGKAEDEHRVIRALESLTEHHEVIMKLLWTSIKDRFHDKIHAAADQTGVGVRQGFKVVLMFEDEECGFLRGLGGLLRIRL